MGVIQRTSPKIYQKDFPAKEDDLDNEAQFADDEREELAIALIDFFGGWDVTVELAPGNAPVRFQLVPRQGKPEYTGTVWRFIREDHENDIGVTCYAGYNPEGYAGATGHYSDICVVAMREQPNHTEDALLAGLWERIDSEAH